MSEIFGAALPTDWSATRLKNVVTHLSRGTAPDYVEEGDVRAISQAANQDGQLDWTRTRFHKFDGPPSTLKGFLKAGDVLINSTGTGTLGRVGFFEGTPDGIPCMADSHITILRADETIANSRYTYYWLRSPQFQDFIYSALAIGATNQIELNREGLASAPIPLPSLEEQGRIADFLDAETGRLDRMIGLRNRQLALYSERLVVRLRNIVAGTDDHSADQKRISWLGPIKESWETTTMSRISRFIMGTTFPHEYQGLDNGDYPFIKVSDFTTAEHSLHIVNVKNWISSEVATHLRARVVPAGSVLYARVGAALLLNRRVVTTQPSVVDDNVRAVFFREGRPLYWANLLSFLDMGKIANPGPVPSVSESQVGSVRITVPPLEEQDHVVRIVQREKDLLQKSQNALLHQVELLAERRQALITAAVTGQFDVSAASGRGVVE